MVKSFIGFINENMENNENFIKKLSRNLIDKIRTSSFNQSQEYFVFSGMEFIEPFLFDLILYVRRDDSPNLEEDSHFSDLPWEKINFDNLGYAIDANSKISKSKVPIIELHIILNPRREPDLFTQLYYRFLDILTHETNHLNQLGLNREPFNVHVSDMEDRNNSKKSYKYFLLRDEIESMIEGMYVRAKAQNIPLDTVFDYYLIPFIKSKYITDSEYLEVLETWVKKAAQFYPDAIFSNKVDNIINSI